MPPSESPSGTLVIATWGAVTGTLALLLEWWKWWRDRGRLRVVAACQPDDTVPPKLSLEAVITNTGRRTLQFTRYVLERPRLTVLGLAVPPWRVVYEKVMVDPVVLKEGDQERMRLSPPQGSLEAARRFRIVDTTGKKWKGKPALRGARIVAERTIDPINALDFGAMGEPGSVHLGLYRPAPGGNDYRLQARFFGPGSSAWYGNYDTKGRIVIAKFADLDTARSAFDEAAHSVREYREKRRNVPRPRSFANARVSSEPL